MFVVKRNAAKEPIDTQKIRSKIEFFANHIYPLTKVDLDVVVNQVKVGLHDGISTRDIDVFTARKCMDLATNELEYGILAARILVNNHHKNTLTSFKDKMEKLYRRKDEAGVTCPLLNRTFYKFVWTNQRKIEAMIDYERDYLTDTFGFLTMEKQYFNRVDGKLIERPQDLYMKEAIALCMNPDDFTDEKALKEIHLIYDLLSTKKFTYATPTLNNSGMVNNQLSSCFLLGTEDSLEGINKTGNDASAISKYGGGIGIHVSNLRSAGMLIRGTNGKSSGVKNFLKIYNEIANAYNQGGKRKGSFAIFLRDYHPDLLEFIQLKNPIGDESARARGLFLCVALSDLFWKTVEADGDWYFVDPEEHLGLDELYGEEFEKVMANLIANKRFAREPMKARVILQEIMKQQFESGVPYIINFDNVNRKNNLKHYSTVRSSNLCVSGDTEILTDKGHIKIKEIVESGKKLKVWNGSEFKKAVFQKTGTDQSLVEITTSDGETLKCTPYHKFYIQQSGKEVEVRAIDLKENDEIIKIVYPTIQFKGTIPYPYDHGYFCGDGTYPNEVIPGLSPIVPEKTNIKTRLQWLSGFMDSRGKMRDTCLSVVSSNLSFLQRVKRMCQTLGTNPFITKESTIQRASKDNKKRRVSESWKLSFTRTETCHLYKQGFYTFKIRNYATDNPQKKDRTVLITSITKLQEREDTYCFNEPDTHRGIFNGILTGNCVEIALPSSSTEYGVCNLASIVLPSFVTDDPSHGDIEKLRVPNYCPANFKNPQFDFKGLLKIAQLLTRTMDRVIDRNFYPVKEAMISNLLHRPIGIGTSGFADICCLLRVPYDSKDGVKLTSFIFETIAYGAYSESTLMAKEYSKGKKYRENKAISGQIFDAYNKFKEYQKLTRKINKLSSRCDMDMVKYNELVKAREDCLENPIPTILDLTKQLGGYPSYYFGEGAPISRGEFQWRMWGLGEKQLSGMFDWETLESHIKRFGMRNALLTAQMPTATTAQIMSVNESVEPFTTNMYRRSVLSGDYIVFNRYLIHDLVSLGLWDEDMKNYLIASNGSIQNIKGIPDTLKKLYKTAWDLDQGIHVQHAAARCPFLDHSFSFNVFIGNSTPIEERAAKLFYTLYNGWKAGLKTGIYYLRTQPAINAQQFSVPLSITKQVKDDLAVYIPMESDDHECLLCGT